MKYTRMKRGNDKYDKVIEVLRKNKPLLNSTHEIEERVLSRISEKAKADNDFSGLIDLFFGWATVRWVRRSLVTVSFLLVIMFVFEQGVILKQINRLSRQINAYISDASGARVDYMSNRFLFYRLSGERFPIHNRNISDIRIRELEQSIDQLKKDYKELLNLIEDDPELKKLIEKKMSGLVKNKIKL